MSKPDRAGRYIQRSTDHRAWVPAPLPPDPPLAYDGELQTSQSSQIEGTQSTLEDVLAFEADAVRDDTPEDVEEVVNHVRAMNHGLARLPALPLSLRLLHELLSEDGSLRTSCAS